YYPPLYLPRFRLWSAAGRSQPAISGHDTLRAVSHWTSRVRGIFLPILWTCMMGACTWVPYTQAAQHRHPEITKIPVEMASVFNASYDGKVFPSTLKLALQDDLGQIMPGFPNIQTLIFLSFECILLLQAAKGCCERIRTVNNRQTLQHASGPPLQS
ncbi:hypothetical protein B0H14DRAFT_2700942, partial [Mycena olivaceomarginata]